MKCLRFSKVGQFKILICSSYSIYPRFCPSARRDALLWTFSSASLSENFIQTLLIFFGSTQKKLEGFVWSFPSITGQHLGDNFPRNAHFWQVGLLNIVLSEYPDKSHNFRNLIFMTSSLQYSIVLHFSALNLNCHRVAGLRVVPHLILGIVEQAKLERA